MAIKDDEQSPMKAAAYALAQASPPSWNAASIATLEGFIAASEATDKAWVIQQMLVCAVRALGYDRIILTTHAEPAELRSIGVLLHNWPTEGVIHLFGFGRTGDWNPLFKSTEQTDAAIDWRTLAKSASAIERDWLDRLQTICPGLGVSQRIRSSLVGASCSLIAKEVSPDAGAFRTAMRMATYAYHLVQYLQRPQLGDAQQLTAREQECLYRAIVFGERPSHVARALGVGVNTVRTLRQKASIRLEARSAEEAAWRMIETGQLFHRGRMSKPRSW
jgi:DNA-binding CsgD family transcriptional regulator